MATLKTNYKDDVLDVTQNELRKFNVINNDDGTISLIDVTKYSQTGDKFGAKDVNSIATEIEEHKNNVNNPHSVTKTQVGLGNVNNTSDANKPVSTAQQEAINNVLSLAKEYTDTSKITVVTTKNTYLYNYRKAGIYYFDKAYEPADLPSSMVVGNEGGWLVNFPDDAEGSKYMFQIWLNGGNRVMYTRYVKLEPLAITSWEELPYSYKKTEINSMLNNHLLVKSFDVSISTLAAAGAGTAYGTFETNIATEGYTPVGVAGFNSNGTNGTSITYGEMYISGSKLYVLARNTNTGKACDSTSKVNVQVLYTKNA